MKALRAQIPTLITAAIKDAGYLHVPEGRRDHTTPADFPPPRSRLRQMRTFAEHAGALLLAQAAGAVCGLLIGLWA